MKSNSDTFLRLRALGSACYVAYFCSGISTVKVKSLRGFVLGGAAFPLKPIK